MRLLPFVALTLAACASAPAIAQPVRSAPRAAGGAYASGSSLDRIERALRARERLELSDDQVRRLDALRAETVGRRERQDSTRRELMSRARAGLIEPGPLTRALAAEDEAVHGRVDAILTDEQRDRLADASRGWPRVPRPAPHPARFRPAPHPPWPALPPARFQPAVHPPEPAFAPAPPRVREPPSAPSLPRRR